MRATMTTTDNHGKKRIGVLLWCVGLCRAFGAAPSFPQSLIITIFSQRRHIPLTQVAHNPKPPRLPQGPRPTRTVVAARCRARRHTCRRRRDFPNPRFGDLEFMLLPRLVNLLKPRTAVRSRRRTSRNRPPVRLSLLSL